MWLNKHICSWFSSSKLPFFSISAQLHSLASVDFFLLFSLCMFSAHKMQADSVSKTTSSHDFVSCVSLCFHVERWPRGLYGGWTAARMGIGKEFTNPKFLTVYQDFGILLNWYRVQSSPPSLFGSSSPYTWRINDWLSCFIMTGMQKILKILRVNILSQGRTWLLTYFTNGLHCDFKKLCNWIIFSVFIF